MITATTKIKAASKEWVVEPQDVDAILRFSEWVAEQEGDPFEGLKEILPLLPEEEAVTIVRNAIETKKQLKCFSPDTPLGQRYLNSPVGVATFFQLLLEKNYPDVTLQEALEVAIAYGEKQKKKAPKPVEESPEGNVLGPSEMSAA